MHLILADDSQQSKPSHRHVAPLVGLGGIHIPDSAADDLERELNRLCRATAFPAGEEFKWSPRPNTWMWSCLHNPARDTFFRQVLTVASLHGVQATVVISDTACRFAISSSTSYEQDVTSMFLERRQRARRRRNDGRGDP